jgi:hypothetical protein
MECLGKVWLFDCTGSEEFAELKFWNKVLIQDLTGMYLPLVLYGCSIFMYLAGCILFPRGIASTRFTTVTAQGEYFRVLIGDIGYYLFIFFAVIVLYTIVLSVWD